MSQRNKDLATIGTATLVVLIALVFQAWRIANLEASIEAHRAYIARRDRQWQTVVDLTIARHEAAQKRAAESETAARRP